MNLHKMLCATAVFAVTLSSMACSQKSSTVDRIVTEVPERPAGQEDMVAFAAEPIDTVRVGFIGLGMRGPGAVKRFTKIPGTKVVALCDLDSANVNNAQRILSDAGLP